VKIRSAHSHQGVSNCNCKSPKTGQRRLLASVVAVTTLVLGTMAPGKAQAKFMYRWLTTSGPTLSASFEVPDAAVSNGVVQASDLSFPPGFAANTSVGKFTNLVAGSCLAVDPVTGGVVASTNSITATNATDTLLLSDSGYFIPSSPLQPRGRGKWNVTHVADQLPLQITFLGFTNGQAQLKVACPADISFILEASADLSQWQPVLTNQVVGGVCTVTDPNLAATTARFYRAVAGL